MMAPRLRELNERVWAIARAESGRPPSWSWPGLVGGQALRCGAPSSLHPDPRRPEHGDAPRDARAPRVLGNSVARASAEAERGCAPRAVAPPAAARPLLRRATAAGRGAATDYALRVLEGGFCERAGRRDDGDGLSHLSGLHGLAAQLTQPQL